MSCLTSLLLALPGCVGAHEGSEFRLGPLPHVPKRSSVDRQLVPATASVGWIPLLTLSDASCFPHVPILLSNVGLSWWRWETHRITRIRVCRFRHGSAGSRRCNGAATPTSRWMCRTYGCDRSYMIAIVTHNEEVLDNLEAFIVKLVVVEVERDDMNVVFNNIPKNRTWEQFLKF